MIRIIIIVLTIAVISCKTDAKKSVENNSSVPQQAQQPQQQLAANTSPISLDLIPDPFSIISKEELESSLGIDPGDIYDVVRNNDANNASRTVFYKISDPDLSNAAVLFATYGNPMTSEIVDESWAWLRIDNLKAQGAGNAGVPDEFEKYEDWDMGLDGAYSREAGKYFWRDANHIIYFIAFNTTHNPDQQFDIAYKLGKRISP